MNFKGALAFGTISARDHTSEEVFSGGYLMCVCGKEQNTTVVSKEVHQNMQKLAGCLTC